MSREHKRGSESKPVEPQPASGAAEPDSQSLIDQLRLEAQSAKEQALTAKEQTIRALADFENTRKRLQREKEEFAKYSTETIIRDLLPILDSLGQALVAVDKQADAEAIIKGVHLIYRQLLGLLEKEGVKRISTIGERFDPHVHEAVAHVDADAAARDKVIEEVQSGYSMHGRVIRPALVKVGKSAEPCADDENRTTEDGKQTSDL